MRDLGYSESYAKSAHLFRTKSWQTLVDEQLPDELLAKVHKELLHQKEWRARDAALDMAYKLKGRYRDTHEIKHELSELSDEELEAKLAEEINELLRELIRTEPKLIRDLMREGNMIK